MPVLDEQGELLRVEAVRADRRVRAEGDLHTGLQRALERRGAGGQRGLRLRGDLRRIVADRRLRPRRIRRPSAWARRYVPRSFIIRTASSSRNEPCSIESIPARIATFAPSAPCAWAAARLWSRCASSTSASISACVSCGVSTSSDEREHATGRAHLDHVGAVLDLKAHRVAELVGTARDAVRDPRLGAESLVGESGVVAVPAARTRARGPRRACAARRRRQRRSRCAGRRRCSRADPTSRTVVKPAISVRRALSEARSAASATVRRKPPIVSAFQSSELFVRQMRVRVDEARQQRGIAEVDDRARPPESADSSRPRRCASPRSPPPRWERSCRGGRRTAGPSEGQSPSCEAAGLALAGCCRALFQRALTVSSCGHSCSPNAGKLGSVHESWTSARILRYVSNDVS